MSSYPLHIVTGSVMASIDRIAIDERGVSAFFLMHQAGQRIARCILSDIPRSDYKIVSILCGKGNNGGDGFVIARCLAEEGIPVRVALLGEMFDLSEDAQVSWRWMESLEISFLECSDGVTLREFFKTPHLEPHLWVDALLGTGAKGAPRGLYNEAIHYLNARSEREWIVSVDIASGVDADTGAVADVAVMADWVYALGLPKVGHVTPPGLSYCKNLAILDIGIPEDLCKNAPGIGELLTDRHIDVWLPKRDLNAHKGSEGRLLVIAGSRGMTGAALMGAKAGIMMGAGLLFCACPQSLLPIYANGVWEMLTLPAAETESGGLSEKAYEQIFTPESAFSAVVIGPGMGRHPSTQAFIKRVVQKSPLPLVVDGDGLNAITVDDLHRRTAPWAATPHPGEMARLYGVTPQNVQQNRLSYAKRLANSSHGVVLLKGAKSIIASQSHLPYINPTGTPAMASGGMGDVLSGMIGALLARGLSTERAVCIGAYLHGRAAEILVEKTGAEALAATQVFEAIPLAISRIRWKPEPLLNRGTQKRAESVDDKFYFRSAEEITWRF